MKNTPSISTGSLVALPNCRKAMVIGVDLAKEGSDHSAEWLVCADGRAEPITANAFMAVPILGTIGERGNGE